MISRVLGETRRFETRRDNAVRVYSVFSLGTAKNVRVLAVRPRLVSLLLLALYDR